MKRACLVILFAFGLVECITPTKFKKYADKHPAEATAVAWSAFDKSSSQAAAYCSVRFPIDPKTTVEYKTDSAAWKRAVDSAISEGVAIGVAASDSSWYESLEQFVPKDTVAMIVARIKQADRDASAKAIARAVHVAVSQCDSISTTLIKQVFVDKRDIEFWKGRGDSAISVAAGKDIIIKEHVDNERALQSRFTKWMWYAIITWVVILAGVVLFVVRSIKPTVTVKTGN